jgi:hypothetical protein
VKVRALFSLAVAAGITGQTFANPPAPLPVSATQPNPNQVLADDVAYRLRSSGNASGADISIVAQEGIVTLSGTAKDAAQKARIFADVKRVTGVIVVRDNVRALSTGVVQVQDPPVDLAPVAPTPLGPTGAPMTPTLAPPLAPPAGAPALGNRWLNRHRWAFRGRPRRTCKPRTCRLTRGRPTPHTTTSAALLTRRRIRTTRSRSSGRTTPSRRCRSAGGRSRSNGKTGTGTWVVTPPRTITGV